MEKRNIYKKIKNNPVWIGLIGTWRLCECRRWTLVWSSTGGTWYNNESAAISTADLWSGSDSSRIYPFQTASLGRETGDTGGFEHTVVGECKVFSSREAKRETSPSELSHDTALAVEPKCLSSSIHSFAAQYKFTLDLFLFLFFLNDKKGANTYFYLVSTWPWQWWLSFLLFILAAPSLSCVLDFWIGHFIYPS